MIINHEGNKGTPKQIAQEILANYIDMMLDGSKYDNEREAKLTHKENEAIYEQVKKLAKRALKLTGTWTNVRLK